MENTKIIVVANDEREHSIIYSRLSELRNELRVHMNSFYSNEHGCWNMYFGSYLNSVKVLIYLKEYKNISGLRCDYFAISTFDIDYAEKWQKQLSSYGKELTTFNSIKEKIKELTSKEDLAIMKDIVKQYIDNDVQAVQAAATRHQVYYGQFFKPLTTLVPAIRKVIFNDPATIVFWMDGTKTIVKAQDGDIFDPEKGLTTAITKKALGNKGNYCNELKKWLPEEEPEEPLKPCTMSELEDSLRKLREVASKTPFFVSKLNSAAKYNRVQKAYDILVSWRDGKVPVSKEISKKMPQIDELIGYLGEVLNG